MVGLRHGRSGATWPCHILHPVFKALKLGYPTKVEGSSTLLLSDSAPSAQRVKLTFPARDNMPKVGMPEVECTGMTAA